MSIFPKLGLEEVKDVRIVNKLIAELIGTMILTFFSCGSAHTGDVVRYSLTFGFTVATMAQVIGHVSGCHINPAVTIGLFVGRKIGAIASVLYIIAQCVGAVLGAAFLLAIQAESTCIGCNLPGGPKIPGVTSFTALGLNSGKAFCVEFFVTYVLILTVYSAAADKDNEVKGSPPLAIGLAIAVGHLFAGPYTGPSMNPARSFGPALVAGIWDGHWVYWLGPIAGGIVAAITYQGLFRAKTFKKEL